MTSVPADIYEYIANFADNRTILNMLLANKQFNDPVLFERIFKRKYPYLIKYKKPEESWKKFYLRMIHYIALLKEKYDFTYPDDIINSNLPKIALEHTDPYYLYEIIHNSRTHGRFFEPVMDIVTRDIMESLVSTEATFWMDKFPDLISVEYKMVDGRAGILFTINEGKPMTGYPTEIDGFPVELTSGWVGF